jgi:hypothetical protein
LEGGKVGPPISCLTEVETVLQPVKMNIPTAAVIRAIG